MVCEICGFNDRVTYDCKKCLPWIFGHGFCAPQVEGQSFFYIDECIDPRVFREKASITVTYVLSREVLAKHIELKFMSLVGSDVWR
jgi:hypothetical protein